MPIMSCTKDGKSGHKFGDSGTCYTGKDSLSKAKRQGAAIEISKHQQGTASTEDFAEIIDGLSFEEQILLNMQYNARVHTENNS